MTASIPPALDPRTAIDEAAAGGLRTDGQRLRAARLAAGMDLQEVATRLKMSLRVVEALEADDHAVLGAPVFVRGQLRSYGRLLGLTTQQSYSGGGMASVAPAVLAPRASTPPMQRAMDRFRQRAVYVVMTAVIAVPVWLATRPHLDAVTADSAPLDVRSTAVSAATGASPPAVSRRQAPAPLVASLAPLPRPAAAPVLALHFNDASWVDITAADGSTLEKALVGKGEQRSYAAGQVSRVVLGNGSAVQVSHAGAVQSLEPYLRANVARFAVSSDGSLEPVAQ